MRPAGAIVVLLGVLAGCGTAPGDPRVGSVTPTSGAEGVDVAIELRGEGFLARVETDFRHRGASVLDGTTQVLLVDGSGAELPAADVVLVDRRTIRATVPASTPRGLYDLKVVDGRGRSGLLAAGFTVTTPAESVARFEFEPLGDQQVDVPFAVHLSAHDESGRLVESFTGSVDLSDDTGTASPATAGPFVRGRLQLVVSVGAVTAATALHVVDALGHGGDSDTFAVTAGAAARVSFTAGPSTGDAGACTGPFTLGLVDRFGFATVGLADLPVTFASSPAGVETFSDASCLTAAPAVTLAAGTGSVDLYLRSLRAGPVVVRAVPDALPSVETSLEVRPRPAERLGFTAAPAQVAAGACSAAFDLQAEDAYGNASAPSGATALDVTATPSTGVELFADDTCATALGVVQLDTSRPDTRFFLRVSAAGALRLRVTGAGLADGWADVEVTP